MRLTRAGGPFRSKTSYGKSPRWSSIRLVPTEKIHWRNDQHLLIRQPGSQPETNLALDSESVSDTAK